MGGVGARGGLSKLPVQAAILSRKQPFQDLGPAVLEGAARVNAAKRLVCRLATLGYEVLLRNECVYLHAFETGSEARAGIGRWIDYYNADRQHSALGGRTPDEAYQGTPDRIKLAA